jgi:hypothetical protein
VARYIATTTVGVLFSFRGQRNSTRYAASSKFPRTAVRTLPAYVWAIRRVGLNPGDATTDTDIR